MTQLEIILFAFIFIVLICIFLHLFAIKKERQELWNQIDYEGYRIDAMRLNFLWSLKIQLIQEEQYEAVKIIDEILQNEYGQDADKHLTFEDIWKEVYK